MAAERDSAPAERIVEANRSKHRGNEGVTYSEIDKESIEKARRRLKGIVRPTPFEKCIELSRRTGASVYLKMECLQRTGSFKIRGAYNKIASLDEPSRKKTIVAASAGNHAQGIGMAAARFGCSARIFVPETTPRNKIEAIRRYPVELTVTGRSYDEAHASAVAHAAGTGGTYVDGFEDPEVIAGQGTVGLEMIESVPDLDAALIPVGGGGLIAGCAVAMKAVRPGIRIIGCQSEASCAMTRSLEQGRALKTFPSEDTIAEGLEGGIGDLTYELGRRLIDEMVLVRETDIRSAIGFLLAHQRLVVEGSGAVGVAALLSGRLKMPGGKLGIVLSGGNLDDELLRRIVAETN